MADPKWLARARTYIGVHENNGDNDGEAIRGFWRRIGLSLWGQPWCAAFACDCLEEEGIRSPRSGWARSFLKWGIPLKSPILGCIVVFARGVSSGHVGFYLGRDASGRTIVLGGNQGDKVSIAAFGMRPIGYRWPTGQPSPDARPQEHGGSAPVFSTGVNPSMAMSKSGWTATAVGFAGVSETLTTGNDIANQLAQARGTAHELGIMELLYAHPGIILGVVLAAAAAFLWWDHRRYRQALAEAQSAT